MLFSKRFWLSALSMACPCPHLVLLDHVASLTSDLGAELGVISEGEYLNHG